MYSVKVTENNRSEKIAEILNKEAAFDTKDVAEVHS